MSYCIYVGKNLTNNGNVFIGGYGDEPSSHWLEVVPEREYPANATITVGVTENADFPGHLTQIPQVERTAKYIGVNYSYYKGVPAPLINGGLNQHHVAVRDVWSPSRKELQDMTPKNQTGPNYSDLARIVLERATSARHAVEIVGELIAKHGYSTYGGNSHLFADCNEGWIVIEFAGGQGLWVAERLGSDDIRVSRPGYIGEIPLDFQESPNYLGSPNLIEFATQQGWFNTSEGKPFNVNLIYGDGQMQWEGVAWMHNELTKRAKNKITLKDMMWAVRTPKLTGDMAGYGQIVELKNNIHPEMGLLWHTQTASATAPFVPFHLGATDVPPEYKKHRYLTAGESALFMNPETDIPEQRSTVAQTIESTRSAFAVFKRLFYLTMQHHEKFLPEVTEAIEAFENKLISQMHVVEKTANALYNAGETDLARQYLTYFSNTEAMNALNLTEALSASIEARTKLLYGFDDAEEAGSPNVIW
jgi:dipeptidase